MISTPARLRCPAGLIQENEMKYDEVIKELFVLALVLTVWGLGSALVVVSWRWALS
jgi:phage FluMu gp28-like protein